MVPGFGFSVFFFIILFSFVADAQNDTGRHIVNGHTVFDVLSFGAVGDGLADDTQAFSSAWRIACEAQSAILFVPTGKRFLVNHSIFLGPCAADFRLQIDGVIQAPRHPSKWTSSKVWLQFKNLNDSFTLSGKGTVLGRGYLWWISACKIIKNQAIQFLMCKNITISMLAVENSPHFHIDILHCEKVQIRHVTIKSPKLSPNTDGIHIEESTNVFISNSIIASGDDCISIGKGSSNVGIKNLTCGPGHGISIGSLGKANSEGNVNKVFVNGAKLVSTDNGLRIKTWQGGYGRARGVVFQNIEMMNVANPVLIDQYYCDSPYPCLNSTYAVEISEVTFKNVFGTSASTAAIRIACSEYVPCRGIVLSNISLSLVSGQQPSALCLNALGISNGTVVPPSCLH